MKNKPTVPSRPLLNDQGEPLMDPPAWAREALLIVRRGLLAQRREVEQEAAD